MRVRASARAYTHSSHATAIAPARFATFMLLSRDTPIPSDVGFF